MNYRELLLGAGASREKRLHPDVLPDYPYLQRPFKNVTTLDMEPTHKPDKVFDLVKLSQGFCLPKTNTGGEYHIESPNTYDEIHAYDVLEHFGAQGDFKAFFAHFSEFWRVLKPGGYFCATVPHWASIWAWGDPGHTRIINLGSLVFLSQSEYVKQVGKTSISDYRAYYKADFKTVWQAEMRESFAFILRAVK